MNFFASSSFGVRMPAALPIFLMPLRRVLERRLHLRMAPVADVAERGGQIVRPDEHAVDALDRGDRLDLLERLAGLDLHQHADLARRRSSDSPSPGRSGWRGPSR